MIVGLPLVAGLLRRGSARAGRPGRDVDLLVATICAVFVLATLKSIADVTQVAQLGRYYLPVFVLMLPTAVAGPASSGWRRVGSGGESSPWLAAGVRRPGLGRPDLGVRRLLVDQAVTSSTGRRSARRATGSRTHPGPRPARRPDHDLVPLGTAGRERPDDRAHFRRNYSTNGTGRSTSLASRKPNGISTTSPTSSTSGATSSSKPQSPRRITRKTVEAGRSRSTTARLAPPGF